MTRTKATERTKRIRLQKENKTLKRLYEELSVENKCLMEEIKRLDRLRERQKPTEKRQGGKE